MFAKCIILLSAVVAISANKPYAGVDPNTLSCDPLGQVHLLLPDYSDCTVFYSCANGVEVQMKCAPGTIFDFELQGCDHAWSGKCTLRTEEVDGSGSGEEEFDLEVEGASNIVEVAKPDGSNFAPKMNCLNPISSAKQLPYNGDCQRFWRCVKFVPVAQYCSEGLYFEPEKQMCDFEANVKCDVQQEDELKGEFIVYN